MKKKSKRVPGPTIEEVRARASRDRNAEAQEKDKAKKNSWIG